MDIHNRPWTKEEFFSHISDFRKPDKESGLSLIEDIGLSEKERQILDIAKSLSYLKDLKDDFRRQGVFYGQKLFEEIAKRIGIEVKDISYMTNAEISNFLDNGERVPKDIIKEREHGFVIYFNHEKNITCKTGNEIKPALGELGISVSEAFSEEIKGMPASPGRAKGVVKVVKGVSDLGKIQKGDILVAVTTHPDYVPAMQKAAAIVTDEGGITSHAAIVARELGLPCVVGTKHATKSFRDGDEAEVDAYAGFVRRLKR